MKHKFNCFYSENHYIRMRSTEPFLFRDAFDLNYGVGILRIPEGLDRNKVPDELLDYNEDSDGEFEISDDGNLLLRFTEGYAFNYCQM